jgi:hypothetical protein
VITTFCGYRGVLIYVYYSDPQFDVKASFFEKSINCTTVAVGDIVEVHTHVYWHGHVFPEFKRQVYIIDPFPENNFQLVSGNNTRQYGGFGGGDQVTYLLKVISTDISAIELPKPRLYIDDSEIPLTGPSAVLELQMVSKSKG